MEPRMTEMRMLNVYIAQNNLYNCKLSKPTWRKITIERAILCPAVTSFFLRISKFPFLHCLKSFFHEPHLSFPFNYSLANQCAHMLLMNKITVVEILQSFHLLKRNIFTYHWPYPRALHQNGMLKKSNPVKALYSSLFLSEIIQVSYC